MEFQNKGVVPVQIAPLLISQPTIKISVLNPSRTASKFKVFETTAREPSSFKFEMHISIAKPQRYAEVEVEGSNPVHKTGDTRARQRGA